jgi:spoIIIJ-associated protein
VNSAEGAGRTVEEAIRNALRALGARREDVDLMVLDEGSRGVLGLGSREARVRLTLLSAVEAGESEEAAAPAEPSVSRDDPVAVARRVTASIVDTMGIGASVTAREEDGSIHVTVSGPQLAPLIGRHGQTLEALDLLVNLMTARQLGRRVPVVVDAERYRERRRDALEALTRRVAGRVRRNGRPAALDPMPPSERRFIHTLLADDPQLTTFSEGEGIERHIVIAPKGDGPAGRAAVPRQPVGAHAGGRIGRTADRPEPADGEEREAMDTDEDAEEAIDR